jgi:hypothetical protein
MMSPKDMMEDAGRATVSLFERSTEIRLCLHLSCAFTYASTVVPLIMHKSILDIEWRNLEQLVPAYWAFTIAGYFLLMGYVLPMTYGVASYFMRWIYIKYFWRLGDHLGRKRGWVSSSELIRRAYEQKDSELLRMVEARKEQCAKEWKEIQETGSLSFSILVLAVGTFFIDPQGGVIALINAYLGLNVTLTLGGILSIPLMTFIANDTTQDFTRRWYVDHGPIYEEVQKDKRIKARSYTE